MKAAHLLKCLVIDVIFILLVIVVRITTILGKENINLMKKFLESLRRSNRQHLMEKLKRGRKPQSWLSGMKKYFQIYNYSNQLKARMAIYNLMGKVDIWWQDLKRVKSIRENNINWSTFKKYFKKKFLSK